MARIGLAVEFEFDPPFVGVGFERDAVTPQGGHHCLEQRRPVRRVPTGEDGDSRLERNLGLVDPADVRCFQS